MSTFWYLLWSSCFIQLLHVVVPTGRKMVFLAIKSATVRESARNSWKSLHSNRLKAVLVLSFLKTYHDTYFWGGVLCCFGIFWTISGIVFKADILSTDNFFELQVSCASTTLYASATATAQIRYQIRVLEAKHNECVSLSQQLVG